MATADLKPGYERVYTVTILVIASACFSTCSSAQKTPKTQNVTASFSVTISPEEPTVKVGSPVWVVATVENKSDHGLPVYRAISNDMDQGGWVYTVDARDDKGVARPETKFYRFAQGRDPEVAKRTSGWATKLKPGETMADRVNVSKLYDLSQPGKYRIQFQRLDPETKTLVKSNEITVTVTPKEPQPIPGPG